MAESSWRRCKHCYKHFNRDDYRSDRGLNTAVQAHEHRCDENPDRIKIHPNFLNSRWHGGRRKAVLVMQTADGMVRPARKAAADRYSPKFCPNCKFDLESHGSKGRIRFNFCPDCGQSLNLG